MSPRSEESRQIVASLLHRVGPDADTARIAQAIVSTVQDMNIALTPIIGQQGVDALYRRSLQLCASTFPQLACVDGREPTAPDLIALASVVVGQSEAEALLFGEVLLTTFYELLTTLIGSSLTARLLRGVWEPFLTAHGDDEA